MPDVFVLDETYKACNRKCSPGTKYFVNQDGMSRDPNVRPNLWESSTNEDEEPTLPLSTFERLQEEFKLYPSFTALEGDAIARISDLVDATGSASAGRALSAAYKTAKNGLDVQKLPRLGKDSIIKSTWEALAKLDRVSGWITLLGRQYLVELVVAARAILKSLSAAPDPKDCSDVPASGGDTEDDDSNDRSHTSTKTGKTGKPRGNPLNREVSDLVDIVWEACQRC